MRVLFSYFRSFVWLPFVCVGSVTSLHEDIFFKYFGLECLWSLWCIWILLSFLFYQLLSVFCSLGHLCAGSFKVISFWVSYSFVWCTVWVLRACFTCILSLMLSAFIRGGFEGSGVTRERWNSEFSELSVFCESKFMAVKYQTSQDFCVCMGILNLTVYEVEINACVCISPSCLLPRSR